MDLNGAKIQKNAIRQSRMAFFLLISLFLGLFQLSEVLNGTNHLRGV